jgi:hypothetical protein
MVHFSDIGPFGAEQLRGLGQLKAAVFFIMLLIVNSRC